MDLKPSGLPPFASSHRNRRYRRPSCRPWAGHNVASPLSASRHPPFSLLPAGAPAAAGVSFQGAALPSCRTSLRGICGRPWKRGVLQPWHASRYTRRNCGTTVYETAALMVRSRLSLLCGVCSLSCCRASGFVAVLIGLRHDESCVWRVVYSPLSPCAWTEGSTYYASPFRVIFYY